MCNPKCLCCIEKDGYKAYRDIWELIGEASPEQARALYLVSAGIVRKNIASAVMMHIASGKNMLATQFPEFLKVDKPITPNLVEFCRSDHA